MPGEINGKPWVITVKAEDGTSTHVYKIKIQNREFVVSRFHILIGSCLALGAAFWLQSVLV